MDGSLKFGFHLVDNRLTMFVGQFLEYALEVFLGLFLDGVDAPLPLTFHYCVIVSLTVQVPVYRGRPFRFTIYNV